MHVELAGSFHACQNAKNLRGRALVRVSNLRFHIVTNFVQRVNFTIKK